MGLMKLGGLGFCDEEVGTANLANLANFEEGGCGGFALQGQVGTATGWDW